MYNLVVKMCEKFHYDAYRNERALAGRKSDNSEKNNNKNKKNKVRIALGDPFPGLKNNGDTVPY